MLGNWLERIDPDLAIIENVQPMMGKGSASQAMMGQLAPWFGMACGRSATVAAYSIPYKLVVPQSWKRHFNLRGSDKEAARKLAVRLVPCYDPLLSKKKDHNKSDALLIAIYGAQKWAGLSTLPGQRLGTGQSLSE